MTTTPMSPMVGMIAEVGCGVGFRMPARRVYCTRALRPASESPPGRNPRAAMRPGAVYGDLAGQRFGRGYSGWCGCGRLDNRGEQLVDEVAVDGAMFV